MICNNNLIELDLGDLRFKFDGGQGFYIFMFNSENRNQESN